MMKMTMSPAVNEGRAPFGIVVKMFDFHVGEQSSNPERYIGAVTQIGFPLRRRSKGRQWLTAPAMMASKV